MLKSFQPYSYQEKIANYLLNERRNVILQAPTGAGKTHAALLPFIRGFEEQRDFPRKCLYSVPMRVLASQFVETYQNAFQHLEDADRYKVSIQTGEQQDAKELENTLIFTTIDQTLSSFLNRPYSLPRRKANLNSGAVLASYLVFDEFHLYDPESTLPTTLQMLQLLQGVTPFILMTATFSTVMLNELAKLLNAVVVPSDESDRNELLQLPSQRKTRRYHLADQVLTAEAVLERHDRRSVVICNTIDRARQLFQMLDKVKGPDTQLLLLHSRLLPEDRKAVEMTIRQKFGKEDNGEGSVIIVSTQAIEVGVDITCQCLHTELAPANAIVQRAGRCARYPGDTGDVYIYRYTTENDEEVDLCENVYPYKDQKQEFALTLEQFSQQSGELDFADEQDIISEVHGQRDEKIVTTLRMNSYEHRRNMFAVMRNDTQSAHVQQLVRDVFQQRVTISSVPDTLLDSPFDAPAFGVHPGTLKKYALNWLNENTDTHWKVMYLVTDSDPDAEELNRSRYGWLKARTADDLWGASLVVVHPALASYDHILGFLPNIPTDLDDPNHWEAKLPQREARQEGQRFTYCLETYEDHIAQVYQAAFEDNGSWEEMANAATRLEACLGWQAGSIERAARIAVLLHDVGKLSKGWQGWVSEYQKRIGRPVEAGQAYAHTDLFEDEHYELERAMKARPPHAVESALASLPVLEMLFDTAPLARAVYSAIARHHSPYSADNKSFQLIKNAQQHVIETLQKAHFEVDLSVLHFDGIHNPVESHADAWHELVIDLSDDPLDEDIAAYWAYLLIVRALRRADQIGTGRGAGRKSL